MFDSETENRLVTVAHSRGIDPAALFAIAEVESGGRLFAIVDGKSEPLIRFEGHYFDRRLVGSKQARARQAGLASPTAGAIRNPADQAARWAMLARASLIDPAAARESVSWGIGQVMGAHWKWLGYASVDALVAECRSGAVGQVTLMMRYVGKAGLMPALQKQDWASFARGYNGPAFAKNAYDTRMADAYRRHRERLDRKPPTFVPPPSEPAFDAPTGPDTSRKARPTLMSWLRTVFWGKPAKIAAGEEQR